MSPISSNHSPVIPIATPFDLTDYPELAGISGISGTGLVARIGLGSYATRTLTGTTNQVNVADGNGVAGNPTISLPQNIHTAATPTFAGITLSGMTSGSVLFAGTGGVVSQDNSNLYWDDTNNRLGIGVTNPTTTLQISTANQAITGTAANLALYTTDAQGVDVGGKLLLGGVATGFANGFPHAGIKGMSENATGSNYAGTLTLFTTTSGGTQTERVRITSTGIVLVGASSAGINGKLQISSVLGMIGTGQIRPSTNADSETLTYYGTRLAIGNTNSQGLSYAAGGLIASVSSAAGSILLDTGGLNDTTGHRLRVTNNGTGITGTMSYGGLDGIALSINSVSKNSMFGGATETASSGLIQLATGTTAANGILWGTDTNLYRSAANTLKTDDALIVADTTASTSSTTGALIVSGGVGIAKALYVANDLVVTPTASANRAVTITGSNGGNPIISTSAGSLAITPNVVMAGTLTTIGGATFHTTSTALTDGAGASTGTLTNAPAAGDPTKWIGINDNGTTRYIPAW